MSDFSCYVRISNSTQHDLTFTPWASSGTWQDYPQIVGANTTTNQMQLEDPWGPVGSSGGFTLTMPGTDLSLTAEFEDPYSGDNSASIGSSGMTPTMNWSFFGATEDAVNFENNAVPAGGHPVYLNFSFSDSAGG